MPRPPKGAPPPDEVLIREVRPRDLGALYQLAAHLDSVNFPQDRRRLQKLIALSRSSFRGTGVAPADRCFVFVLELAGEVMGASMIIAQHGTPDAPHIYFEVVPDERYSRTLNRHFHHQTLHLGFSYRGPTEIGALVLDPKRRGLGLGRPLSFIRFVFLAMFPKRFRPQVIAELMPPLKADGTSDLWEHLGRRFTGLDYREADQLSHSNKEFVAALFPQTPIHAAILPPKIQALIGAVGDATRPVQHMLEAVGFEYSHRIDPFDGGPHFEAPLSEIQVVKDTQRLAVADEKAAPTEGRAIIATAQRSGPAQFRATVGPHRVHRKRVQLDSKSRQRLRVRPGDTVWVYPLP